MLSISELTARHAKSGKLEWIGIRPRRRAPLIMPESVQIELKGLKGDRTSSPSKRSVTLIQAEHLPVIAALCGHEKLDPAIFRRNLMVSHINLLSLRNKYFRIGETILEGTGICAPCSLMEKALGTGGYNAMRGHGGITAKVIKAGNVAIDDEVSLVLAEPDLK